MSCSSRTPGARLVLPASPMDIARPLDPIVARVAGGSCRGPVVPDSLVQPCAALPVRLPALEAAGGPYGIPLLENLIGLLRARHTGALPADILDADTMDAIRTRTSALVTWMATLSPDRHAARPNTSTLGILSLLSLDTDVMRAAFSRMPAVTPSLMHWEAILEPLEAESRFLDVLFTTNSYVSIATLESELISDRRPLWLARHSRRLEDILILRANSLTLWLHARIAGTGYCPDILAPLIRRQIAAGPAARGTMLTGLRHDMHGFSALLAGLAEREDGASLLTSLVPRLTAEDHPAARLLASGHGRLACLSRAGRLRDVLVDPVPFTRALIEQAL